MPRSRLLPPPCRPHTPYARLRLLVALSLFSGPSAQLFQTDGALAHPLYLPLPPGLGVAVSVDDFGPPPRHPSGETPTYYSSRSGLADAQTHTLSPLRNLRLKAPPTSWSTTTCLFDGAPPASSPILGCNSAPSCHLPRTSCYCRITCGKSATSAYHPSGSGGVERVKIQHHFRCS